MIRKFEERDLETVMELWLAGNLQAHSFIPKRYWKDSRELVKDLLPSASLYVYTEETGRPDGFIGLSGDYIEGHRRRPPGLCKGRARCPHPPRISEK